MTTIPLKIIFYVTQVRKASSSIKKKNRFVFRCQWCQKSTLSSMMWEFSKSCASMKQWMEIWGVNTDNITHIWLVSKSELFHLPFTSWMFNILEILKLCIHVFNMSPQCCWTQQVQILDLGRCLSAQFCQHAIREQRDAAGATRYSPHPHWRGTPARLLRHQR